MGDFREGEQIEAIGSELIGIRQAMYRAKARGKWLLVWTRTERAFPTDTMVELLWRCALPLTNRNGLAESNHVPIGSKESPLELMLKSGQLPYIPAREYGWELG